MFDGCATLLEQAGYGVVNPHALPDFGPANPYETNLRITLSGLLRCNAVALLAGWQDSHSARREVTLAGTCGMVIAPLDYWLVENAT